MPEQQHCRFQLLISTDLRQKVYELMQEGKSKKEISSIIWWRVMGDFALTIPAVMAADRAAVGVFRSSGYWHWRLGHKRPLAASVRLVPSVS
ncbi:cytochrome c-type biogenesis protein CcmH [Shigella flexneri]